MPRERYPTADPLLKPFMPVIERRAMRFRALERKLASGTASGRLEDFASAHEYYGMHLIAGGRRVFREHAPNAERIWLVGDFSGWERRAEFELARIPDGSGDWSLELPAGAVRHGQFYHLELAWRGGEGVRLPAYARRCVQDGATKLFAAQVWDAPGGGHAWRDAAWRVPRRDPVIYEAHVGMAREEPVVGTWDDFRRDVLPRVADDGFNTLQLMAVMEHPYYGSFGYQVSNFFASSSRFGTPEGLKRLVDEAHGRGIAVIMDLVHSHAVLNETEGVARFDGTPYCYCHDGARGRHRVWDSALFDYGRDHTLHFLLSNCRFWLDEYHFDGFRFDGVTSMLYDHHGLGWDFGSYDDYFGSHVDEDALAYLALANRVVHAVRPDAVTIAEDVSGMPGLAAPASEGGVGFDYRMAMGVTEAWGRLVRKVRDEDWPMGWLAYQLGDKRPDERTVSYAECHDQALVGGKTLFFELAGTAVYDAMHRSSGSLAAERAVALDKLVRLATFATCGGGFLEFMGNEFGHPEWIDFPREGNGWSYSHARRQWSLRFDPALRYGAIAAWEKAFLALAKARPHLFESGVKVLVADESAKVLAVSRDDLFFVFNFHPTAPAAGWSMAVPPGRYSMVLDSDAPQFGGNGPARPDRPAVARTQSERWGESRVLALHADLPPRTALVFERVRVSAN
ncbi:MAG: alpha amylase C-terminal domain-containing protein [Kiritimatiellae bacterium]|nr:alpha amylase C-terminal domain-containing protein [Kiritimatiellia bacterium]